MTASRATLLLLIMYLSMFSLWPFYIDIRIADSVGLNPQRLALAVLIVFALFAFMADPSTRRHLISLQRAFPLLFVACIIYSLIRLASGAANGAASFFIAAYEVVSNIALIFVSIIAVRSLNDARLLFLALITCGLAVSAYAIIERYQGHNLFSQFADPDTRAGFTAIMDKTRDGAYRVQSTFEHPLSLSQYLVIIAPLALVFIRSKKWFLLSGVSFLCMLAAAAFTGSRSALVAPVAALLVASTVAAYFKFKARGSGAGGFALLLVASLSLVVALLVLPSIILGQGSQSQTASTTTRLAQIQNGYIAVKSRPLLGYGPGRASAVIMSTGDTETGAQTIHRETTDNLFLTRVVESGIPSLFLYLSIILITLRTGAKSIYTLESSERRLRYLLFVSTASGALTMLILSIFTVLPVLFVMFGVIIAISRTDVKPPTHPMKA